MMLWQPLTCECRIVVPSEEEVAIPHALNKCALHQVSDSYAHLQEVLRHNRKMSQNNG